MKLFYPFKRLIVTKEVPLGTSIRNGRRVGNGVSVSDKRNAIRLNCDYKCLLQHDDIEYPCGLKNISTSGALVDVSFIIPVHIQLGDTCDLLIGTHNTMSPLNYKSKVTRLEDSKIAVRFLKKSLCI